MGLQTIGLDEILVVTGDPSKIGDFPGATSVYDLSSFDLISLIRQFNEGDFLYWTKSWAKNKL